MTGCYAPMLYVCGYSWVDVVLQCFMGVGFRSWILCFMLQVWGFMGGCSDA